MRFETIHEWDDVTGQQVSNNKESTTQHAWGDMHQERASVELALHFGTNQSFFAMAILIFLQAGFRHDRLIMSWGSRTHTR